MMVIKVHLGTVLKRYVNDYFLTIFTCITVFYMCATAFIFW